MTKAILMAVSCLVVQAQVPAPAVLYGHVVRLGPSLSFVILTTVLR